MRALQLNIRARFGPYRDREPRLRALFAHLAPDLIAMQEVDELDGDRVGRGGGFDSWEAAAAALWPS